jgi:hypothetical protein
MADFVLLPQTELLISRHEFDDTGDLDVGSIFGSIAKGISGAAKGLAKGAKAVGKGVAAGARGVATASKAVGGALKSVPIVGAGLAGVYNLSVGAPFGVAAGILSGQRIDKAVFNDLKNKLASVKDVAPYVQTVISVVPGVGPGVAGAIAGGLALASGAKLSDALIAATKGALPGGALAQAAFDVGKAAIQGQPLDKVALSALPLNATQKRALEAGLGAVKAIAHGQRVDQAVVDNALKALPADAKKAIQIGMALGHGQVLQAVGTASQLSAVQKAGSSISSAASNAASSAARSAVQSVGKAVGAKNVMNPINVIGKNARNIFGQVSNALPAPTRRNPISIVSRDVQRAVTQLKKNPVLATVPASQLARVAGVSSNAAARALQSGRYGLSWKPLSGPAAALTRFHSPFSAVKALTDTRGLSPDGLVYVVEKGDYPGKIAKLLTGKEGNWPQLVAANPQKKTVNRGIGPEFATLVAGESLKIPTSWRKPAVVTAPGEAPPSNAPQVVVNDPARANAAAILQAKGLLVAWSKTDGAKVAGFPDYGTRAEDLSATYGDRDKFMLTSFEQWSNANRGTNMATDGVLTDQAAAALRDWAEKRVSVPIPSLPPAAEPVQAPPVQAQPAPTSSPLPTLPGLPALPSLPTLPLPTIELPTMTIPGEAAPSPTTPTTPAKKGGFALALAGAVTGGLLFGLPGAAIGAGAGLVLEG